MPLMSLSNPLESIVDQPALVTKDRMSMAHEEQC